MARASSGSRRSAERYLHELHEDLKDGSYRPSPVKRVEIPKGDGRTRPLGIPTIKDRIVQTALKMVIEPIFEVQFRPGSYGFRPGRSCKDALREVDRLVKEGFTLRGGRRPRRAISTRSRTTRLMALVASIDQRWPRAGADRELPAAGHHEGHGAMAADDAERRKAR